MSDDADRIEIGVVSKAHGIKGEILVIPHDPASQSLIDAATVWIAGRAYPVARARDVGGAFLLQLDGLTDRDVAAGLRGQAVAVTRDDAIDDEDDVLLADLVGCQTRLPDGTPWGEIVAVDLGEMQDRLIIHHDGKEKMLPVVDVFVVDIDLDARVVTVDPPEGLPEEPVP